ncbi:hypothetical protein KC343_g14716, partial [Hortaea werneckii]
MSDHGDHSRIHHDHHYSYSPGPSTNSKAPVARQPANLRFQRRTSERAFYEGALRESTPSTPIMDYGAASGSSPWASSPDASRTSFGDSVPRQDLPGPAIAEEQEEQQQQQVPQDPHLSQGFGEENRRPASAARYHNVPSQPSQQGARSPQPQQQQPQHQQHMPQYKMQAKITGLERTGKKDSIFRFDVHTNLPK